MSLFDNKSSSIYQITKLNKSGSDGFSSKSGFTILELIIVIAIIGILAAISLVSYNGIQNRVEDTKAKSDASNAAKQLELRRISERTFPIGTTNPDLTVSDGVNVQYNSDGITYKLTVVSERNNDISYCITSEKPTPTKGLCDGHVADVGGGGEPEPPAGPTPLYMQTVDAYNCPSDRTMAVDKRDDKSYWIQSIGGACWMMTDLAYTGGGDNTYSDTKTIAGTSGYSYSQSRAFSGSSTTSTTFPTEPSTTTRTGQIGVYYNWCAAMGGQSVACRNTASTSVDRSINICPAGWSVPSRARMQSLVASLGGGTTSSGEVTFRSGWLAQHGGYWGDGYYGVGTDGNYWTSTPGSTANDIYIMEVVVGDGVYNSNAYNKQLGFHVRCVAEGVE